MIRFEEWDGRPLYLSVDLVVGLREVEATSGETCTFVMLTPTTGHTVRGKPDEVAACLKERPTNLSSVLQGAWNETRKMADQSAGGVAHTERVLLLVLAEKLGVIIDRDARGPVAASTT